MKVINFGSLNIDHVYKVDHFIRPGETQNSVDYTLFCGGKGLNQSIALSYSGATVYHAGKVGKDGHILIEKLKECGVNTQYVKTDSGPSGHAIIQVNQDGENCILLHSGANEKITVKEIEDALTSFSKGDYLLLQNEINNIAHIIKIAKNKGLKIVINPAPMNARVFTYPLELIDIFIVNEVEGKDLTGYSDPDEILKEMHKKFPKAAIVLTLGSKGVKYLDKETSLYEPADTSVTVVDTTAAGDTFIGYFLGTLTNENTIENALKIATKTSAICVSKAGASSSIPKLDLVKKH